MKTSYLYLLLLLCAFSFNAFCQKTYLIHLDNVPVKVEKRDFYIAKVVDIREDKSNIGFVKKGITNKKLIADFQDGFEISIKNFFDINMPKRSGQTPIILKISKLEISEKNGYGTEYAFATFTSDFWSNGVKVFDCETNAKISGFDVTEYHESNIRLAMIDCLNEFEKSDWKNISKIVSGKDTIEEVLDTIEDNSENVYKNEAYEIENEKKIVKESLDDAGSNENVFAIGYQIGGFNIVGIDYEIRVHDYLGVHFGVGYLGFTAGLKIHTEPGKNSSFFNISYKDLGIQLLDAVAIEYGNRKVFVPKIDLAFHYQIGLGFLTFANQDFLQAAYGTTEISPASIVIGLGLSW